MKDIVKQIVSTPSFTVGAWSYDDYWAAKRGTKMGVPNDFQTQRARWIATRVPPSATVLDLGSGDGAQLLEIMRQTRIEATAVDFSDAALAHLRSLGIKTLKCDLQDLPSLENLPRADHVTMLEVIEHTGNAEALLLTGCQMAKTSLIFSIPNTGYISYRARLLFGRFPVQWRVNPGEHLRFWTRSDLAWWLKQLGLLENATIHGYAGIPLLNRWWPNLFAAGLIAEIRKK